MDATLLFRQLRLTCATSMLVAAAACPAVAQTPNDEVETSVTSPRAAQVANQVARSVVQVVATPYGSDRLSGVVNLQRLVGAGTIVDEAGYSLPAHRAGIREGDVIVAVNHQPVANMELATLHLALYTLREGQALTLDVARGGHTFELTPTAVSVVDLIASR